MIIAATRAFLILASLIWAAAASGEAVELRAKEGDIVIRGELLNIDGTTYRVASPYGILTVNADATICEGPGCPGPDGFVSEWMISGDVESTRHLAPALIEGFAAAEGLGFARQVEDDTHELYALINVEKERTVARIRLRHTRAREGFADLVAEQAGMALALRPPSEAEMALAADAGLGPLDSPRQARLLALDGLVALAGASVPVDRLSYTDLQAILRGQITRWDALDGPDASISLILPPPESGAAAALRSRLSAEVAVEGRQTVAVDAVAGAVAADPFALGITLYSRRAGLVPLAISGPCGHSIAPSLQSLKSEDYPLTLPHYLHLPRWRLQPVAERFLTYVATDEAQEAIARAGFADQTIQGRALADQGERLIKSIRTTGRDVTARSLRQVIAVLGPAARLSPTFRFEGGADTLDTPSRASIRVVSEAIRSGAFDDSRLLIVGFTDAAGGAAANIDLSRRRATAVRDALTAALGADNAERVPLEIHGFGEAMPLACNDAAWGRETNRRVELWQVQR